MINFKKALLVLLGIELIFCYLLALRRTGSLVLPFQDLGFYLSLGIVLVPSFFIAFVIITLFFKDGRENKVLFYSHLTVFSLFVLLNVYWLIEANINNKSSNEMSVEDFPKEQEQAWLALIKEMGSSNHLNLKSSWIEPGSDVRPLSVYITYFVNKDFENEHYSRLEKVEGNYIVKEHGFATGNKKIDSLKSVIPPDLIQLTEE